MKRFKFVIIGLVFIATMFTGAIAQNSVEGSLTVDGSTAAIKHIYFDQYRDEFTIILTNNPIAPEMIPDGVYTLSEEGKVRALEFTVSRETKKMLSRMRKSIYFHPVWTREINIGNGVLTLSKFDEEMLVGTIKTPAENEYDGHHFSYDISFSVSLKKKPLELTMTGKTDASSKAYAAYCRALLAGDIDEFLKYVLQEKLEIMPKDKNELALGLEFMQSMMMIDMEVLSSTVTGKQSVLTINGSRGIATSTGTVTMLLENGTWKVSEESWETGLTE